jgi:hypothetical protein
MAPGKHTRGDARAGYRSKSKFGGIFDHVGGGIGRDLHERVARCIAILAFNQKPASRRVALRHRCQRLRGRAPRRIA